MDFRRRSCRDRASTVRRHGNNYVGTLCLHRSDSGNVFVPPALIQLPQRGVRAPAPEQGKDRVVASTRDLQKNATPLPSS